MGAKTSGHICDIRAYEFIESILNKVPCREHIILHKINYNQLLQILTTRVCRISKLADRAHELLMFTFELSKESIYNLDITIYKGQRFKTKSVIF